MSDERKILERSIKDHQAAIDKARKGLEKLEATYSTGDRFKSESKKYILVMCGRDEVLISGLDDGYWWSQPTTVKNITCITSVEFYQHDGNKHLIRYWDNKKQERV